MSEQKPRRGLRWIGAALGWVKQCISLVGFFDDAKIWMGWPATSIMGLSLKAFRYQSMDSSSGLSQR